MSKQKVDIELFISLLKEYPFLWDPREKLYKNKLIKNEYWSMIGRRVGLTINECQIQFNSLKAKFRKEKKEMECATGSAATTKKPWIYWESAQFLNDSVAITPRR